MYLALIFTCHFLVVVLTAANDNAFRHSYLQDSIGTYDAIDGYVGFNDVNKMPFAASDISANLFTADETSDTTDAIFITGGCIAEQGCSTNSANGVRSCYCGYFNSSAPDWKVYSNATIYFQPSKNIWKTAQNAPRPRYRHCAAKANGKLYVFGGRNRADNIIPEVDVFDPKKHEWTGNVATFDAAYMTSDNVAFAMGDTIHIIGGYFNNYTASSIVSSYNTTSGTWTYDSVPPLPLGGRGDIGLGEVNGNIVVLGGFEAYPSAALSRVEEYDPKTNKWTSLADMQYGRGDLAVGVMNSQLFSIGGETISDFTSTASVPVKYVGRLNTEEGAAGKWTTEANITIGLFRFAGVSYEGTIYGSSSRQAIYLFGGQSYYNEFTQSHVLSDTTILYVPRSVASRNKALTDGEIAGAVIGTIVGVIVATIIILSLCGYCVYNRYRQLKDTAEPANFKSSPV